MPAIPVESHKDKYGTEYYIDSDNSAYVLTQEQMDENALYLWDFVQDEYPDWTKEAVAAMCGNFRWEGVMNPSQWEFGKGKSLEWGYGLGQWTPATKLIDYVTALGYQRWDIKGQMVRVWYESQTPGAQWIETEKYPISMTEFLTSTLPADTLAVVWLYNWERPADPEFSKKNRQEAANYYYGILGGKRRHDRNRMPIWMYPWFRRGYID